MPSWLNTARVGPATDKIKALADLPRSNLNVFQNLPFDIKAVERKALRVILHIRCRGIDPEPLSFIQLPEATDMSPIEGSVSQL